jgi:hypothetical protein
VQVAAGTQHNGNPTRRRFAQGYVDGVGEDRVDVSHIAAPEPVPDSPRKARGVSQAVRAVYPYSLHGCGAMELDRLFAVPRTLIRGQDGDLMSCLGLMAYESLHHRCGTATFLR